MLFKSIINIFVINLMIFNVFCQDKCVIDITRDIGLPQPIILNPKKTDFYLPSQNGLITLNDGDLIGIGCPGSTIMINSIPINVDFRTALCHNGRFIIDGGTMATFESITCEKLITATSKLTDNKCFKTFPVNYKDILIGFKFNSDTNNFLTLITVCFDTEEENPIYSKFELTKNNPIRQLNVARPSWTSGSYYSVDKLNNLYLKSVQRETINELVGLESNDHKYINDTNSFLNRGHLTAMADFIYAPQQQSTFFYANSAPQWASFNGGNWKKLEEEIRDFSANNKDLTIYTGTHDILTFPNETDLSPVPIYLYNYNLTQKIPVPKTFWKVIYDPNTATALAFIGINNPFAEKIEENYVFCTDICDDVSFALFDRKNITNGYIFCCELEDFRTTVKNLPDLEVKGLLLKNSSERLALIKTGFLVLIALIVNF